MAASVFASVVFLKIQDFARRSASEQARLRGQLEAVVAVITAEIEPFGRIILDAADGVAVVVLRDPQATLLLAERAMSAAAGGLPLCAGINHGVVQLAGDKGAKGVAGDGIAVAASVAEFAAPSPSRLLTSRAFRDALAESAPGREASLVKAGAVADRGLRMHELFSSQPPAARRRAQRHAAAAIVAAVVLLGAGLGARIARDGQEAFTRNMAAKYHDTAAQGRNYFRALVNRVKL
jgi:hypothetical protein